MKPTVRLSKGSSRILEETLEICILAGGLSSRMGQDKAKLRFGGKSLLARIRATAKSLKIPVRVVRRDLLPRCGPMGGIFTAFKTSKADAILFLACDMPLVSGALLQKLLAIYHSHHGAVFSLNEDVAGFPFVLNRSALPLVEQLISEKQFSLQNLAKKSRAKRFQAGGSFPNDFLNLNTPRDLMKLKQTFPEKD